MFFSTFIGIFQLTHKKNKSGKRSFFYFRPAGQAPKALLCQSLGQSAEVTHFVLASGHSVVDPVLTSVSEAHLLCVPENSSKALTHTVPNKNHLLPKRGNLRLKCLSFFQFRIPGIGMEKLHSFSRKLYGPIESRPCQAAITAMSSADGCLLCSKTWWSLESGSISNPKREISVIRVQKTMGVLLLHNWKLERLNNVWYMYIYTYRHVIFQV